MASTITTGQLASDLDAEFLEAAAIAEQYGDDVLDVLAEDWTRMQMDLAEIAYRQALAGVDVAPVITLPIPVSQLRPPEPLRSAA
jgi:hypothetical protein